MHLPQIDLGPGLGDEPVVTSNVLEEPLLLSDDEGEKSFLHQLTFVLTLILLPNASRSPLSNLSKSPLAFNVDRRPF